MLLVGARPDKRSLTVRAAYNVKHGITPVNGPTSGIVFPDAIPFINMMRAVLRKDPLPCEGVKTTKYVKVEARFARIYSEQEEAWK